QAQIGSTGVAGLLIFLFLVFLVITFNIDFNLPVREKKAKPVVDEVRPAGDAPIAEANWRKERDNASRQTIDRDSNQRPTINSVYANKQKSNNDVASAETEPVQLDANARNLELDPKGSKLTDVDNKNVQKETESEIPGLAVEDVVEEKQADSN